jgi:acetolactate synthase I/II/III large subunit
MKRTGAWLAVYALEQLGVRYTFGIPGVHTVELYDALNNSRQMTPVLVADERGGAFMADAVSRLSNQIGTLVIVPAAGITHAASGIAEAYLAGVPMLVICGGIRTDSRHRFQLHEIDLRQFVAGFTKQAFQIREHADVVPTIFQAYDLAVTGEPGPVLVELPANLQLFPGEVGDLPHREPTVAPDAIDETAIARAAGLLLAARRPGLFLGWGARGAYEEARAIAEFLQAPVATTLQGLSAFPANHALHAGFGFGPAAVPAARNAFQDCDALLAVGTRFAELATGSYSARVPENLVHVDVNPAVLNANYPAKIAVVGDARAALSSLLRALQSAGAPRAEDTRLLQQIRHDKDSYRKHWYQTPDTGRVNPARFFDGLRQALPDDAVIVVDDGNHTYLTAELFPIHAVGSVVLPTDFNCMGYAVPAGIGAKLARPESEVAVIVGDGAFLMTGLEIVTAARLRLGVVYYVFHDGALSQIAQAQEVTYNRQPCTQPGPVNLEGVALATGAAYVRLSNDAEITEAIATARSEAARSRPAIVDVAIDYAKPTAFT